MCLYQFDFLFTPWATAALSKLNTHTQTHTLLSLSLSSEITDLISMKQLSCVSLCFKSWTWAIQMHFLAPPAGQWMFNVCERWFNSTAYVNLNSYVFISVHDVELDHKCESVLEAVITVVVLRWPHVSVWTTGCENKQHSRSCSLTLRQWVSVNAPTKKKKNLFRILFSVVQGLTKLQSHSAGTLWPV